MRKKVMMKLIFKYIAVIMSVVVFKFLGAYFGFDPYSVGLVNGGFIMFMGIYL